MQAIGLRNRFFITILFVLFIITMTSVYLYSLFLQRERMALIDQQVRETAAALVDSQLGDLRKIDFDKADDIISEELGESRIGKFFIIKNANGETIFESASARLLPIAEIPKDQQWFEIPIKDKILRGLNLKLPRFPDRTLQVGLVLDDKLIQPTYLSQTSILFLLAVFFLGLIVSFFSTSYLLRPIGSLDIFLSEITSTLKSNTLLPLVPSSVIKNPKLSSSDELERVVAGLNLLITKLNKNYQFSRLWGYQMAHELKTPLSRIGMEIEKIQKRNNLSSEEVLGMTHETARIAETINSFLGWAELENSSQQKHLFMNRLTDVINDALNTISGASNRVLLIDSQNTLVASNPTHLGQVVQNLIINAIKHSGANSNIILRAFDNELQVEDNGPGISKDVMDRIGEPFNRGVSMSEDSKGHGLGLAWVTSICRHYGWSISFTQRNPGTQISIKFARNSTDPSMRNIDIDNDNLKYILPFTGIILIQSAAMPQLAQWSFL